MICDLMFVTDCLCKAQGILELYTNGHYHEDVEMVDVDRSLSELTEGLYNQSRWDDNFEILEDARHHIHRIRHFMNANWEWET